MAAARAGGCGGREVPHQVAFNRRYVPLLAELRERIRLLPAGATLQHVRYEMVRVNRRDPDFSTTAVHAIDAVRFIAGADFAESASATSACPTWGTASPTSSWTR